MAIVCCKPPLKIQSKNTPKTPLLCCTAHTDIHTCQYTLSSMTMAPLVLGTHIHSSVRTGCQPLLQSLRRPRAPGRYPTRRSNCNMTVQAAAAVSNALKVYEADSMDAALLKDFASRPRVDFQSILERVSEYRVDVPTGCSYTSPCRTLHTGGSNRRQCACSWGRGCQRVHTAI